MVAYAGEVYRLLVRDFLDNPGERDTWAAFKGFTRAAKEGRIASAPAVKVGEPVSPTFLRFAPCRPGDPPPSPLP